MRKIWKSGLTWKLSRNVLQVEEHWQVNSAKQYSEQKTPQIVNWVFTSFNGNGFILFK